MRELRILSPTAILGYGFPEQSFLEGMKRNPHVIAVDAGSSDPGPYYLGAGVSFTDRNAVKRDLEIMLKWGLEKKIPVIIGTAGGSGAESHLEWNIDIIKEIVKEKEYSFKMAVIHAEIDKQLVLNKFKEGKVNPLHPVPKATKEDILQSVRIVGQMGPEPYIKALEEGAEVIIGGRTYDPAVFSALAIKEGYGKGLAIHMGKILECAAIAASPGSGSDCMFGYLRDDCFILEALNPIRKCTVTSISAHTLYEKTNPYILPGPGGVLDLTDTNFEQYSDTMVKVSGSRFVPSEKYFIKLEGAKKIGYRTVSIAGARDSIMISQIDDIIQSVKDRVNDNFLEFGYKYYLNVIVYGKNGVMGSLEPNKDFVPQEVGIIIEAVAPTQEIANTICIFARSTMLHFGYKGRIATAGNLAFPYSPSDFKAGEVYNFSLYHLIEVDDPSELFPMEIENVRGE